MSYLSHFPKPLLRDLIEGRWLPIIGAGFSLNAITPSNKKMPLWDELGKTIADELIDYPYTGAVDAISAYEHEFSRSRLIERLSELLCIDDVRPGDAHHAFSKLYFDIVCTTNFDFLLENAYDVNKRSCHPVLDEDQLSINISGSNVKLLKLHGDIHHPQRMVVTENDYELFLENYPLIATYLANLLITRTPVFIGYSLDDPDFRMIWRVVSNRLGRLRRQAYSIIVDGRSFELSRFERRGVKPINLPGEKKNYGSILSKTFHELSVYLRQNILNYSHITEEEALKELSLPPDSSTRLCFFAVPFSLQAFYKDNIFPVVKEFGLVPVTADEVISPGDNIVGKIDAIISRASAIIADVSNKNTLYEIRIAFSHINPSNILIIFDDRDRLPPDLRELRCIHRTKDDLANPENLIHKLTNWLETISTEISAALENEPLRLLNSRAYRAAIISVFTLFETILRKKLENKLSLWLRPSSLSNLLRLSVKEELIDQKEITDLKDWISLRNAVVHTDKKVTKQLAEVVVHEVFNLTKKIAQQGHSL